MKTSHDETIDPDLERMLREVRPEADPAFLTELDERAAAGFGGGKAKASAGSRLKAWLGAAAPRLAGAGAVALTCIALVAAVSAIPGGGDDSSEEAADGPSVRVVTDSAEEGSGGASAQVPNEFFGSLRQQGPEEAARGIPSVAVAPPEAAESAAPTGPFAADRDRRAIERSASLTLGTDPESVRGAAEEIFGIVGRYDGIVLSSSIQDGPEGEAGARFDLMIPSDRLSSALADLSAVAEVRSREESTVDITAPTVTVGERLQDARAEIEGLLDQLAAADTNGERFAAKQQLGFQRRRVASLRSTLSRLERRANLSRVSLQVVTGDEATFPGGSEDESWTIGDAVDDAGQILSTAAGVTLIALAVLAPFALIALLAWLARRAWVRQGRERALEG